MVGFMHLNRSQQQLFIFFSSRFHIQGLSEVCCSRVKVKLSVSWVSYHLTVRVLSLLSEKRLAFILLSGLEVNGTDLCRHIPVPIMIRFVLSSCLYYGLLLLPVIHSLVYCLHPCHSAYVSFFMHHVTSPPCCGSLVLSGRHHHRAHAIHSQCEIFV